MICTWYQDKQVLPTIQLLKYWDEMSEYLKRTIVLLYVWELTGDDPEGDRLKTKQQVLTQLFIR